MLTSKPNSNFYQLGSRFGTNAKSTGMKQHTHPYALIDKPFSVIAVLPVKARAASHPPRRATMISKDTLFFEARRQVLCVTRSISTLFYWLCVQVLCSVLSPVPSPFLLFWRQLKVAVVLPACPGCPPLFLVTMMQEIIGCQPSPSLFYSQRCIPSICRSVLLEHPSHVQFYSQHNRYHSGLQVTFLDSSSYLWLLGPLSKGLLMAFAWFPTDFHSERSIGAFRNPRSRIRSQQKQTFVCTFMILKKYLYVNYITLRYSFISVYPFTDEQGLLPHP